MWRGGGGFERVFALVECNVVALGLYVLFWVGREGGGGGGVWKRPLAVFNAEGGDEGGGGRFLRAEFGVRVDLLFCSK